ncbi:MAG TPA: hypothetical protein VGJ01_21255 [Pseudolabrys sp.]|jgi:hypothetical protein
MRPTRLSTTFRANAALVGLALGAALLAAPAPARAEDNEPSIDQKVMRGIMEGLGLKRDGEATINYQERAPLVIPPRLDLPPPEKSDAIIANNPAWPKDPDIARRKEADRLQRNRNISEEREREQNPLSPSQMTTGPAPKRQARTADNYQAPQGDFANPLPPSQLGYVGGLFGKMFGKKDDDVSSFTGEPPRASLTEPPPGYQTPSPDQPYGTAKAGPPKATNYYGTFGELAR